MAALPEPPRGFPDLVTVEQFRQLPEGGEVCYELHQGEVVRMTRPKARHSELQHRLMTLLTPRFAAFGVVRIEYPYRPVAEFELRAADVAVVSRARWEAIDPDDNLRGAPELVIEVRSPSNTAAGLRETAALCLANGAFQFWLVDAEKQTVQVGYRNGTTAVFRVDGELPLADFGGGSLPVAEIFG